MIGTLSFGGAAIASGVDIGANMLGVGADSSAGTSFYVVEATIRTPFVDDVGPADLGWLTTPILALCAVEAAPTTTTILRSSDVGYRTLPTDAGGVLDYPPTLAEGITFDVSANLDPAAPSVAAAWGTVTLENIDRRYDDVVETTQSDGQAIRILRGTKRYEQFPGYRTARSTTGTAMGSTGALLSYGPLAVRYDLSGGGQVALNEVAATNYVRLDAQQPGAANVTVTLTTDVPAIIDGQPVYKHLRTLTGGDSNTGALTVTGSQLPLKPWLPRQPAAPADTVMDLELLYSLYGGLIQIIGREDPDNGFAFTPAFGLGDFDLHLTRASTVATYFDDQGFLHTAPVNWPRIDYDPVTLISNGLMVEPARTNSLRNSMMTGGSGPSTLPTNWAQNNNTALVPTYAYGTQNGLSYLDFTLNGNTAVGTQNNLFFEGSTQVAAAVGQIWTASMWVKLFAGALTNVSSIVLYITEHDAGGVQLSFSSSTFTPTASWQRVFHTRTLASATTAFVKCQMTLTFLAAPRAINLTLRLAATQLERGETPSSFIPTTTVAVARSADVVTMPANALIPLDRTNYLRESGQINFGGSYWHSQGVGALPPQITPNAALAPDGTLTASLVTVFAVSGGTNSSFIYNDCGGLDGDFTASVWLRGAVGGEHVYISATQNDILYYRKSITLSTSWTRYSFSGTLGNTFYLYIGTALTDASQIATPQASFYAWGAQIEAGGVLTDYIPTTSASVTISGRMTGCTLIAECYVPVAPSAACEIVGLHQSIANKTSINITAGNNLAIFDSGGLNSSLGAVPVSSIFKVGFSFVSGTQRGCVNGGTVVNGSLALLQANVFKLALGCDTSGQQAVCYFRNLRVIRRLLTAAELQAETAKVTLRVSCYVWLPAALTLSSMTVGLEQNVSGGGTGSANTSLRDQWQRVSGNALLAMGAASTFAVVRYSSATNGHIFYTTGWQVEVDTGGATSFIPPRADVEYFNFESNFYDVPTFRAADLLYVARNIWLDPAYEDLVQVFKGVMGPWFRTPTSVQVALRDASYYLERQLPRVLYTGAGGLEGSSALAGRPKPLAIGSAGLRDHGEDILNATPVLVDGPNQIYQVHDGEVFFDPVLGGGITPVNDGGFNGSTFDVDVDDLYSGIATPGTYRTCCKLGLFQLGSPPTFAVTCDFPAGPEYVVSGAFPDLEGSQLMTVQARRILDRLSVPIELIASDVSAIAVDGIGCNPTALNNTLWLDIGLYLTSDDTPSGIELLSRLLSPSGGTLVPGRDGRLRIFVPAVVPAGASPALSLDNTNIVSIERLALPSTVDPPPWRFRIAHDHNWTVMTSGLAAGTGLHDHTWLASPFRVDSTAFANPSNLRLTARPSDPPVLGQACALSAVGTGTSPGIVAQDLVDLWGVPRKLYGISIPQGLADQTDWGTLIRVTCDFDGLDNGPIGQCCGWRYSSQEATATLRVLI